MFRRTLAALVLAGAIVLPATPAHAAPRGGGCGTRPLGTLAATRACWGGLVASSCDWPAAWMIRVVHRESRGWPKAWNPTPVHVRGGGTVHAGGLFGQLGVSPQASPRAQARSACALYHRQGRRAWAVR